MSLEVRATASLSAPHKWRKVFTRSHCVSTQLRSWTTSTTQAGGQIFQLVPSGTKYKLKGTGDAFMAVVADQLTMNATFAVRM